MKRTLHLMFIMTLLLCNINLFAQEDDVYQVSLGTGTTTDNSTPFIPKHIFSWCETIYPGTEIGGACTINAISYHSTATENSESSLLLKKLDVYMAVTPKDAFKSQIDWTSSENLIKVYSGENVVIGDTPWEKINLDLPFYYNGNDNLVVVVAKEAASFKWDCNWYYTKDNTDLTCTLYYGNDVTESIASRPPTTANLGNRMTYKANIILDVVYGEVSSPISVSPNPIDLGYRPIASWTRPAQVEFSTDAKTAYIFDIESSTPSFVVSTFQAPAEVSKENPFSVAVKLSNTNVVGEFNGTLNVKSNYATDEIALKATTYVPVNSDVWEKAEVVTSYPYSHTPDFDNIYDNYYLPGEAQDGPDAVYKLTLEEPATLAVGVNGENAKMALYASDFNGKGGPDVDNYYGAAVDPNKPSEPEFPEESLPELQGNSFSYNFDDGSLEAWKTLDADGDSFNWGITTDGSFNAGDAKCLYSLSYSSVMFSKLTPDNYIFTKGSYTIDRNSVLEFDVKAVDPDNFRDETYAVVVSVDGKDFETIAKETCTDAEWHHKTISLADYAGQDVVIGFRHFEAGTKSYAILIDNAVLTPGRGVRFNKTEKYTVPAGTYYLAVSATERFSVNINATTENGFNPITEVLAQEIDDNSIELKWSWDFITKGIELLNNKSLNRNREEKNNATVLGYNVYRRNTTDATEPKLIAENLTDTSYLDNTWNTASMGLYQWGVSVIYDNNGANYETPVAYSNTIGKDMFTTFDLIVTTENAASPAGTKVAFYNVYEPSFKYETTLDETGKCHWDSFRRGTYRYSMSLEGYKPGPQNELLEVWDESKLEYTFEEIFVLGDLFVSSTGWAMWKPNWGGDIPETFTVWLDGEVVAEVWDYYYQFDVTNLVEGQEYTAKVYDMEYTWTYIPCDELVQATNLEVEAYGKEITVNWTLPVQGYEAVPSEFKFDFESGTLNGWVAIDADGDGYGWYNSKEYSQSESGYQSWYSAISHSSMDVNALTPDNYLTTIKKYHITENSKLNFNVSAEKKKYSQEHYGIAISTNTNYNVGDFKTIFEETLPDDDNSSSFHGQWYSRTVDLSEYAGQDVYIAFRHFNCTNQFWINIDDVKLTTEKDRKESGEWLTYEEGNNNEAMGLQGGIPFYWAVMFPAADLQQYAGRALTKVSIHDVTAHDGRFMIYLGGDKAPGTLIHTQEYKTTGSQDYVEFELANSVDITGGQNLWVVFNNYNNQKVASACIGPTNPNGRWFSFDGKEWVDILNYAGLNLTWRVRAYVENEPIPNATDLEVLGAMLYRDGKLLTYEPNTREKFVETLPEYGEYEYSLRVVYGGEEETYYAMSCPQNITLNHEIKCKAPKNLYGSSNIIDGKIGTLLEWPYTLHGSEWLYYDDGKVDGALGLGGAPVYWAVMFTPEDLEFYHGTLLTKVALYDNELHDGRFNIYYGGDDAPDMLIHSQAYECTGSKDIVEFELTAPIPVDATTNLWVVFNNNNGNYPAAISKDTGNKNGRWMSTDGETWADIGSVPDLAGTFMIRAFVTSEYRGETVALGQDRNEEASFSHYNVYRGTSMNNLKLIAQPTVGYYFDEIEKGTYYYQVTATYYEGDVVCESDYANSYLMPEDNYIMVEVTAIDEDGVSVVMIYPNPTNSNLNITAEGLKHITVFNALGQVMYDNGTNSDNEIINMSRYDAGIYMVRIVTENGMLVRRVSVVK